jgi:hypothetical protein
MRALGILKIFLVIGLLNLAVISKGQEAFSQATDPSDSSPSSFRWGVGLGYGLYSGVSEESFSGLSLVQARLTYGRTAGLIRPQLGLRLQVTNGDLKLLENQTNVQAVTLGVGAGLQIYLLPEGGVAPFIGVEGYAERGSLKFSSPPTGYNPFNRPNAFGYEINLGFDIQKSSLSKFRLGVAYGYELLKVGQLTAITNPSFKVFVSF